MPSSFSSKSPEGEESSLITRLVEELQRRWHSGDHPLVEEFLNRHPELWTQPALAAELLYEEICLRRELGKEVSTQEIVGRFPQWSDHLQFLLDYQRVLDPAATSFSLSPGDRFGDCSLLAELGRGAQGQVFLAVQPALANRPVVLKVVPLASQEHLSLARLQHTYIVPIYYVQDDPGRNLRALGMPYFGGATLDRILAALSPSPADQRSGQQILAILEQIQAAAPLALPSRVPWEHFFRGISFTQAICSIGICLAEALQYAHERGLLHLDLKPSNVLLTADGQPMLLDFHLARAPISAGGAPPTWLGGTPGYMAPEHFAALKSIQEGIPSAVSVDARADIYSLGVLLWEALGGKLPAAPGRLSGILQRANRAVTPGLADILARCLASAPRDRYPTAGSVAADLRRHLADLPLEGVANRNWVERWSKWRRRRPFAFPVVVFVLACAFGGGMLLEHGWHQRDKARALLEEGQDQLRHKQHAEVIGAAKRGLDILEHLPFSEDLRLEFRRQLRQAEQAQAVGELHAFTEQMRALSQADDLSSPEVQKIEERCRAFWDKRRQITQTLELDTSPEWRQQARADLMDLAILGTRLHLRRTPAPALAGRREALQVLTEVEELFGSNQALWQERLGHAEMLQMPELVREAKRQALLHPPRTAWDHLTVGRALLHTGKLEQAKEHLERALVLQPHSLWANFHLGKLHYQQGRFQEALCSFWVCVALAPDRGWCHYNRGLARMGCGQRKEAFADLDRALELDPGLGTAALTRATLFHQEKDYARALADLRYALLHGVNPTVVAYNQAVVQLNQGDVEAARASLNSVLQHDSRHKEARALLESLPPQH